MTGCIAWVQRRQTKRSDESEVSAEREESSEVLSSIHSTNVVSSNAVGRHARALMLARQRSKEAYCSGSEDECRGAAHFLSNGHIAPATNLWESERRRLSELRKTDDTDGESHRPTGCELYGFCLPLDRPRRTSRSFGKHTNSATTSSEMKQQHHNDTVASTTGVCESLTLATSTECVPVITSPVTTASCCVLHSPISTVSPQTSPPTTPGATKGMERDKEVVSDGEMVSSSSRGGGKRRSYGPDTSPTSLTSTSSSSSSSLLRFLSIIDMFPRPSTYHRTSPNISPNTSPRHMDNTDVLVDSEGVGVSQHARVRVSKRASHISTFIPSPHRGFIIDNDRRCVIRFATQCKRRQGGVLREWLMRPTKGNGLGPLHLHNNNNNNNNNNNKAHRHHVNSKSEATQTSGATKDRQMNSTTTPSGGGVAMRSSLSKHSAQHTGDERLTTTAGEQKQHTATGHTSHISTRGSHHKQQQQQQSSSCQPTGTCHPAASLAAHRRRSFVSRTVVEGGVIYGPPITVQTDLTLPNQPAAYFEVELDGMESIPEDTVVAVGLAPPGYPSHQIPGVLRGSMSFTSVGTLLIGEPSPVSCSSRLRIGDVIGVLVQQPQGIVSYTLNGVHVIDVQFDPLLIGEPLHVTLGLMGVGDVEVNFGCKSFIYGHDLFVDIGNGVRVSADTCGFGTDVQHLNDLKMRLELFYQSNNPVVVSQVDRIAKRYLGREQELESDLEAHYGFGLRSWWSDAAMSIGRTASIAMERDHFHSDENE